MHPLGPRAAEFHVSSRFGAPRGTGPHQGVDIACPVGTPLYAVGRVIRIDRVGDNRLEANGNAVWLVHDDVRYAYLHMDTVSVKVGEVVDGEVVGTSGNTGDSTGPHVHVGCWREGPTSKQRPLMDPAGPWGEPSWSVHSP